MKCATERTRVSTRRKSPRRPRRAGAAAAVVAVAVAMAAGGVARAQQVIVGDTFSGGGDGATLVGRTPDTNGRPGGEWVQATGQASWQTTLTEGYGDPLPGSFGTFQSASAIPLNSVYTPPSQFTISADIAPRDVSGAASAGRGVALGFFSAVGPGQQFSQNLFTGLVLDNQGNLALVQDPNATGFFDPGSTLGPVVPFAGAFDANQLRTLRYDVDTTTGAISNVSLEGSTADYSAFNNTTLFTQPATNFAGMYSSSAVASGLPALDNFLISAIPEPAALGLLGVAGAGLLARRRRRRS